MRASTLLRAHRSGLVNSAMRELGAERYSVEQILRIVVERAEKLAPVGARHASATRCAIHAGCSSISRACTRRVKVRHLAL